VYDAIISMRRLYDCFASFKELFRKWEPKDIFICRKRAL
jgi:hypothetical protein